MTKHTSGPWVQFAIDGKCDAIMAAMREGDVCTFRQPPTDADARLMAAAPDLLEAAQLLEKAEEVHANCDECEGEDVPELCPKCFPFFDDARVKRRLAIAKAADADTLVASAHQLGE